MDYGDRKSDWKNKRFVGSIGGIICGVQLIPLIGSILPTNNIKEF